MTWRNWLVHTCVPLFTLFLSAHSSFDQTILPVPVEQVAVTTVTVRMSDHGPVVLLQAEGRVIPIFVDVTVALSIQGALSGERLARPMSHDLMRTILEAYGGKVLRTVITRKDRTYYGALTVAMQGEVKTFDSRSSDSIALAVHFNAPILVGRDLLESSENIEDQATGKEL
jgi:bifunctional DNase/RNase